MPHATTIEVTQIGPTFAAELQGLDFSQPISDETLEELKQIIGKYGVVSVRKFGPKSDDELIAFGARFGELDSIRPHKKAGRKMRIPQEEIFDISNLDNQWEIVTTADAERTATAFGNALWHADGTFNPRRTHLSMLRAVTLPPEGTGGHTEFLDAAAAYDDLSAEMKEKIKDLVACHSLLHNRKVANPDSPLFQDIVVQDHPMGKHKVVQRHYITGRSVLFINSYAHHIDGMPLEEGQALIRELFDHMKQDKYKYVHHWKSPGDFVIWDNTGVLHRATIGNYQHNHVRDLRRVSTLDSGPAAYGMNDPNTKWQQGLP
jgi:alpha-ketoglutarate-dependent 2,4-dichlorophenoxyacetate dioxygenase